MTSHDHIWRPFSNPMSSLFFSRKVVVWFFRALIIDLECSWRFYLFVSWYILLTIVNNWIKWLLLLWLFMVNHHSGKFFLILSKQIFISKTKTRRDFWTPACQGSAVAFSMGQTRIWRNPYWWSLGVSNGGSPTRWAPPIVINGLTWCPYVTGVK